ncbi:MAG TPA: hypothetical protein VNR87_17335 [Flavisolibacter sp.]|nr:hypothetical protein [Flavisolibacter sp.]
MRLDYCSCLPATSTPYTTMDDLSALDLTALRNLLLKELREFLTALDSEPSHLLIARKERIREIDREIELKKNRGRRVQRK